MTALINFKLYHITIQQDCKRPLNKDNNIYHQDITVKEIHVPIHRYTSDIKTIMNSVSHNDWSRRRCKMHKKIKYPFLLIKKVLQIDLCLKKTRDVLV